MIQCDICNELIPRVDHYMNRIYVDRERFFTCKTCAERFQEDCDVIDAYCEEYKEKAIKKWFDENTWQKQESTGIETKTGTKSG